MHDEKIVTGLNGLAIEGLARSGAILQLEGLVDATSGAGERIWRQAYDEKSATLSHPIFEGETQSAGFLSDYALLGSGYLTLYTATGEQKWRERGLVLADAMLKRFYADDGHFSTSEEKDLLIAPFDTGDDAYPSGVSGAIEFLFRLSRHAQDPRYANAALKALGYLSGRIDANPALWASTIVALNDNTGSVSLIAGVANRGTDKSADHLQVSMNWSDEHDGVVVTLTIDSGYHVNANPASLGFLIPTQVEFVDPAPTSIDYSAAVAFTPLFTDEGLDVYEGVVQIDVRFANADITTHDRLDGVVTVQACNKRVCLPPSQIDVAL